MRCWLSGLANVTTAVALFTSNSTSSTAPVPPPDRFSFSKYSTMRSRVWTPATRPDTWTAHTATSGWRSNIVTERRTSDTVCGRPHTRSAAEHAPFTSHSVYYVSFKLVSNEPDSLTVQFKKIQCASIAHVLYQHNSADLAEQKKVLTWWWNCLQITRMDHEEIKVDRVPADRSKNCEIVLGIHKLILRFEGQAA